MKLLVIGNAVVLASRDREEIINDVPVTVEGAIEKATLNLTPSGGGEMISVEISSETAVIKGGLSEGKTYAITVTWTDIDGTRREAWGASIMVRKNDFGTLEILPAMLSTATSIEYMWHAIVNTLEVIVPYIDDQRNGHDAV